MSVVTSLTTVPACNYVLTYGYRAYVVLVVRDHLPCVGRAGLTLGQDDARSCPGPSDEKSSESSDLDGDWAPRPFPLEHQEWGYVQYTRYNRPGELSVYELSAVNFSRACGSHLAMLVGAGMLTPRKLRAFLGPVAPSLVNKCLCLPVPLHPHPARSRTSMSGTIHPCRSDPCVP
jgi:hypothetical protein